MIVIKVVVLMWLGYLAQVLTGGWLTHYGIRPHDLDGLVGIVMAPILHGDLSHLCSNTVAILAFGLGAYRNEPQFKRLSAFVVLLGGFGTWLISPANVNVIGASGLAFGYFGFTVMLGIFQRNFKNLLVSLVFIMFFGSQVLGILPGQPMVSWQAHLCGFLAGIFYARLEGLNKPAPSPA